MRVVSELDLRFVWLLVDGGCWALALGCVVNEEDGGWRGGLRFWSSLSRGFRLLLLSFLVLLCVLLGPPSRRLLLEGSRSPVVVSIKGGIG